MTDELEYGNYLSYERFDTANGIGIRSSLFFSGCSLHCKGCWNPTSWNPKNGYHITKSFLEEIVENLDHPAIDGMSLLGGEPFENLAAAIDLTNMIRSRFGYSKTIWSWSGYLFDDLKKGSKSLTLLKNLDVLVDGPFILNKRDLSLQFRGSSNQRIIKVQESITADKAILWN